MLYVNSDGTIQLTRGDTARLSIDIHNNILDEPYEIQKDDVLILTVKKTATRQEFYFQKKVVGTNSFHILPEDTQGMSFGRYVYDVQITTKNSDVYTVIGPCSFDIMKEVTY